MARYTGVENKKHLIGFNKESQVVASEFGVN